MATTKRRARARTESQQASTLPSSDVGLLKVLQRLSVPRTILLISLFSFLAYANSLAGEFVFDDTEQIVENQNIRSWDNLGKAFTTHVWQFRERPGALNVPAPLPYYRPLFTAMLTIEYHLFGLWPQGWHLSSLLLHICCSIGVFFVIRQMSEQNVPALFASLLFAVHPVHAESVSWISGMTDPLFGVFFLASLYLYLSARAPSGHRPSDRRLFALSLGMFALSTLAKETSLSLVLLIFGYELIELTGLMRDRLITAAKRALPYAGVVLLYLVPRYLVLGESMWKNPQAPERPLAYTLLTSPFVILSYFAHLLWPIGLSVTYNTHFVTSVASLRFLLPGAGLVLISAALFVYRKRISRGVWKAILLIVVPLLPVLNLGQISQEEYLVFDHYLYLSVAGLGYLVAIGIFKLVTVTSASGAGKNRSLEPRRSAFAAAIFATILLLLTVATARENRSWTDLYSLWSNAARVRPAYWAPHYNAGLALLEARRFDEARDELERAVSLKTDAPEVFDAVGRAYDGMGDTAGAISSYERALALDPNMIESLNNLGSVYFKRNNYAAAEKYFAAAVAINPQASTTLYNLGLCYSRQGRLGDAIRQFERVRDLGSADDETYYELGLAYEKTGRLSDAISALKRARDIARSEDLAARVLERLNGIQRQM